MEIILAALLASKAVLPAVDRETLDLQARAEALRPQPAAAAKLRPSSGRRSVDTLDLTTITTICRAAGSHANPVAYVSRLGRAYELSASQQLSLRSNCAAYLHARADTMRILRTR